MGRMMTGGTPAERRGHAPARISWWMVRSSGRRSSVRITPGGLLTERDVWFRGRIAARPGARGVHRGRARLACRRSASRGASCGPIAAVTRAAEALRHGDRSARTGMTGGDPIADLGATFDEMADAVEAERAFEQQLTADVAHELRTPLQAIQATVEAMQDGVLPDR